MFDYISIAAALVLLLLSSKQYSLIAFFVFLEFALHKIAFVLGIQYTNALNPILIYPTYMAIQVFSLAMMFRYQAHLFITFLIFANLGYNFLTTLHHLGITTIDFHGMYKSVVEPIMILELLYLAGISAYVRRSLAKHGFINTNHIDRTFRVRRGLHSGALS